MPSLTARSSRVSRPDIGFIRETPSFSGSSPLSTLRNGTTPRSCHRKAGTGLPLTSPSMVRSNRMAAITLAPVKDGDVMMRTRISCISLNISASSPCQALSRDAVGAQRARCRAAALIERSDEARLGGYLLVHLVLGHDHPPACWCKSLDCHGPSDGGVISFGCANRSCRCQMNGDVVSAHRKAYRFRPDANIRRNQAKERIPDELITRARRRGRGATCRGHSQIGRA